MALCLTPAPPKKDGSFTRILYLCELRNRHYRATMKAPLLHPRLVNVHFVLHTEAGKKRKRK